MARRGRPPKVEDLGEVEQKQIKLPKGTREQQEFLSLACRKMQWDFLQRVYRLNDREFCNIYLKMCEFILPKGVAMEIEQRAKLIDLPHEELVKISVEILNKIDEHKKSVDEC